MLRAILTFHYPTFCWLPLANFDLSSCQTCPASLFDMRTAFVKVDAFHNVPTVRNATGVLFKYRAICIRFALNNAERR